MHTTVTSKKLFMQAKVERGANRQNNHIHFERKESTPTEPLREPQERQCILQKIFVGRFVNFFFFFFFCEPFFRLIPNPGLMIRQTQNPCVTVSRIFFLLPRVRVIRLKRSEQSRAALKKTAVDSQIPCVFSKT